MWAFLTQFTSKVQDEFSIRFNNSIFGGRLFPSEIDLIGIAIPSPTQWSGTLLLVYSWIAGAFKLALLSVLSTDHRRQEDGMEMSATVPGVESIKVPTIQMPAHGRISRNNKVDSAPFFAASLPACRWGVSRPEMDDETEMFCVFVRTGCQAVFLSLRLVSNECSHSPFWNMIWTSKVSVVPGSQVSRYFWFFDQDSHQLPQCRTMAR